MNYKVFLLAFFISAVICEESSEEDTQSNTSNQRIYNNGQPLTLPQLIQIPGFNGGYNPTTLSPLQTGQYNPTTASPLFQNQQQTGAYNPSSASPLYIQSQQPTGAYNPTTASPLYIQNQQQTGSYNPTSASPLFIQSQQPTGAYNPTTPSPLYIQQQPGQQPIQVIQVPQKPNNIYVQNHGQNQGQQPIQVIQVPQKPNNIYVQTQPQNQGQVVVIPNKKPGRPSRPNKRPTTTVQPPIYIQTQPQQHHTQTPVQVIQVTGKPTTVSPPIVIQTQQPQQGHHPIQVVTLPNQQQFEPQQEIYQIHPGQLDNPSDYEFNWFVNNQESGDYKSHREVRQNDVVQGQYEVVDPDGYRRIVSYTADELHGFRAVVRRIPLNAGYVSTTQKPLYNNNNNYYFGGSTTQRPFGSRGKKHASVAPLENTSSESESNEQ